MVGYSGRSQAAKLGLRAGQRVALHEQPPGWDLADPPSGLVEADPSGEAMAFKRETARAGAA